MKDRDIGHLSLLTILMLFLGGCLSTDPSDRSPPVTSTDQPTSTTSATPTEIAPTVTATVASSATATRLPPSPAASPTSASLCNADDVSAFVRAFIDAFNAGDQDRLDSLLPIENYPFAPTVLQPGTNPHQFRGFNLRSEVVIDRSALLAELAARQASGERWEIDDVVIDPELDPVFEMPQIAVFGLQLTQLTGAGAQYHVTGKGAVNCVDGTLLFFWGG